MVIIRFVDILDMNRNLNTKKFKASLTTLFFFLLFESKFMMQSPDDEIITTSIWKKELISKKYINYKWKEEKKYILQNRKSKKRKEWERAQINKNIKKKPTKNAKNK